MNDNQYLKINLYIINQILRISQTFLVQMKQDQKTTYQNFTKEELIISLRLKDSEITMLRDEENKKIGHNEVYRQRLEQQIQENQKAIQSFRQISQFIISLVTKIKGSQKKTTQEENILSEKQLNQNYQILGNGAMKQDDLENSLQFDDEYSFKEIMSETFTILATLDALVQNLLQQNKNKNSGGRNVDLLEYRTLKQQNQERHRQNKILKHLYSSLEEQHKNLINKIKNAVPEKVVEQMKLMDKPGLINLNKQLTFQVSELKKDQKIAFQKNMREKQSEKIKYQKILSSLKQQKSMLKQQN